LVVFALAAMEIKPEARICESETGTAGIGVNLFHEFIRCPYQFVGVKGGQWKGQATDAAVFAGIIQRIFHVRQWET
jgi:hypothetical protein